MDVQAEGYVPSALGKFFSLTRLPHEGSAFPVPLVPPYTGTYNNGYLEVASDDGTQNGAQEKALVATLEMKKRTRTSYQLLRVVLVFFGCILSIILMVDSAGFAAFSSYSHEGESSSCPILVSVYDGLPIKTSDEAASLGLMAGVFGAAVSLLLLLVFVFSLLVGPLNHGRTQLLLVCGMEVCCLCVAGFFILSVAVLQRDMYNVQAYIDANSDLNVKSANRYDDGKDKEMGMDRDKDRDKDKDKDRDKDRDKEKEKDYKKLKKESCEVPEFWEATSMLGMFGVCGWVGIALWILIWLVTTRIAAKQRVGMTVIPSSLSVLYL